jgi:cyanate permease
VTLAKGRSRVVANARDADAGLPAARSTANSTACSRWVTGFSPFVIGLIRDRPGSYDLPLLASAAFVLLSALLTLASPRRTSSFLVNRSSFVETTA